MAAPRGTPLDEIQWRSPALAQSMGGIHTNSVLHYFAQSPFFDATSNNATLTTQATYNPSMLYLIQTREVFENRLRTMQGLEFMVAYEPKQPTDQEPSTSAGDPSVIWVIRKQNRRKRSGYEDEVSVISSYFIIGENVYMSPSVGNVIGSRLLSTVTSLTKFLSTASSLPLFSPSLGNIYMRPTPVAPTSASGSQLTQTSKEGTPVAETVLRAVKAPVASQTASTTEAVQEARSLAESFNMTLRYMNEYMDENPLLGEPGSFILSSTHGSSQSKNASQPRSTVLANPTDTDMTDFPTDANSSDAVTKKTSRSGDKSPMTSGAPGKLKRRKSKAPSSGGGVTPT